MTSETRSLCVFRHTDDYLRHSRTSLETFGQALVQHYHDTVPDVLIPAANGKDEPQPLRSVKFHASGDAYAVTRANSQILRRFMTGEARLPADLEESWVAALVALAPEAGARLKSELAQRYGFLAAPIPRAGEPAGPEGLARFLLESGQMTTAVAKMIATKGGIGPEDLPLAGEALQELHDVMSAATALKAQIHAAMPGKVTKLNGARQCNA